MKYQIKTFIARKGIFFIIVALKITVFQAFVIKNHLLKQMREKDNGNEAKQKCYKKRTKHQKVILFNESLALSRENSFRITFQQKNAKLPVYFPYQPYQQQTYLIEKLRSGVLNSQNVLIESPTGTGKTLCTLAGVLSALAIPKQLAESENRDKFCHKIYYLTRTHSQITQVMNELKRLPWYKLKANIIASRDQLCINKNLTLLKGRQLEKGCQDMCKQKLCKYKEEMTEKGSNKLMKQLMSVDQLKQKCSKNFVCPFYLSKASTQESELTIMPFNYLLDWNMFEKNNFSLKNSVIIFDEAHNVDSLAQEGSSLTLTSELLSQSIAELKNLKQAIQCKYLHKQFNNEDEQNGGYLAQIFNIIMAIKNRLKSHNGKQVIFTNLHDITSSLKQMTNPNTSEDSEGMNLGNYDEILYNFDRTLKLFGSKGLPCDQTTSVYQNLKKIFDLLDNNPGRIEEDYYVSISSIDSQEVVYKFNCLNASFCFERLEKEKPRSIILCSGTLGSFDMLSAELGIQFPVQIKIPSYVSKKQVSTHILSKFTNKNGRNEEYDFSFQKKSRVWQYEKLGEQFSKLEKVVPNGIVVAFSTYQLLEKTIKNCLHLKKQIFYQSKKTNNQNTFQKYSQEARQNGAFLFIVMKGRFAEGINFSDELCRCMVLVGIPFLPMYDCRVMRKKQAIQRRYNRQKADQWYLLQTFKTVNQVIGRVIRSKKDYGVLLIIDQRFEKQQILQQMPQWVKSSLGSPSSSERDFDQKFEKFFAQQPWKTIDLSTGKDETHRFEGKQNQFSKTTILDKKSKSQQISLLLQKQTPPKKNKTQQNGKKENKKKKLMIKEADSSEEGQPEKNDIEAEREDTFSKFSNQIQTKYKVEYPWLSIDYFINQTAFQSSHGDQGKNLGKLCEQTEQFQPWKIGQLETESRQDKIEAQVISFNRKKKKPSYYDF